MSCEPECPGLPSSCTPHGAGIIVTDKLKLPALPGIDPGTTTPDLPDPSTDDIPDLPDSNHCAGTGYLNAAQTTTQTCEEGSPTEAITVTIPYGTFFSEFSQEDADDKALARACSQALQLRVCTPCEAAPVPPDPEPTPTVYFNTAQTVTLQCDSMSPEVTYTVLAATYSSEVDQDYADGLAADAALIEVLGRMDCVWSNMEQTATASCPSPTAGPDVSKTVLAGSFFSHDSQWDADQQAYNAALAEATADLVCSRVAN